MQYYGPMMERGDSGYGLLAMAVWALIIVLIVLAVLRVVRHQNSHPASNTGAEPLDIAKARYAKGEIDKVQFEQLKKDLQ